MRYNIALNTFVLDLLFVNALLAVARAKHKFFEVQNKTGISVFSLFAHVSCCLYWIQFCLQPIENMSSSFISILRETWNIADILFNSMK